MHRSTWKKGEMKIARLFGSTRTPLSGINSRHTGSDSLNPILYIEVKHMKRIPADNLWMKTEEKAKKENKIPLIVLIKKGSHSPLILCKLEDIKKIANEKKDKESEKIDKLLNNKKFCEFAIEYEKENQAL